MSDTPLTPEALERLEKAAEAATPEGWKRGGDITCDCPSGYSNCWHQFDKQADIFPDGNYCGPIATVAQKEFDNATYIALANPTTILALLSAYRAQESELSRLRPIPHVMGRVGRALSSKIEKVRFIARNPHLLDADPSKVVAALREAKMVSRSTSSCDVHAEELVYEAKVLLIEARAQEGK